VPGIGRRTAERILVELRDSLAGGALGAVPPDGEPAGEISVHRADDPRLLAREGLVGLGFTIEEAERLLSSAEGDQPELLVQQALKAARA
jgi:Holliday junction DNA helicase RuvA